VNVLANSIVSGNGRDCDGRPDQRVASMDRDGTCGAMTVDPQLAALADNGGLVQTMALPAGSPAVAGGDPSTCPSTDARGASRPIPSIFGPPHPKCDIGAFERSGEFQAQSATGAGPVSFATSTGTFVNFHAVKENTLPTAGKPPGVTFPFGLFDWTVIDLTPGQIVTVTLTFPSPVPVPPQYWKVNTGTGLWTNVCLLLPCVVNPSSPKVLQLTITDGGVGDLDGIVNGVIRDPGGLGVSAGGPPVARCKDVTVSTSPGICSAMSASVDAGSSDPDGDSITITQSPTGPFPLGTTAVTLTVTDSHGASAQCRATVTVVDKEPPKTTCPAAITKECTGPTGTDVSVVPSASDNCSAVTASCSPSGPFPVSSTAVTCTATDTAGNTSACTTPVKVVDTTPPVVTCERVRKPRGNDKDDDRERRKYRDAKHKDHDDDDDDEVFFRVSASDVCSTPKLTIGGIPLANGETIGIEQSRKPGVRLVEIEDGIREFKVGPGQAMITATDAAGNTATAVCPVPPKDRDDDKGRDRDDDKE
jgi:hypothetical protein